MNRPKRTYPNAGAQTAQAHLEAVRFWDEGDDYLVPVKTIAIVLNINRNKVNQIPVQRRMIDKRVYYRKGDVLTWSNEELKRPDSLLRQLQAEQAKANERMRRQPSRRYVAEQIKGEDAEQARDKTKARKGRRPDDSYETNLIIRKSGASDTEFQRWSTTGRNAKAAKDLLNLWTWSTKSKRD